MDCSIEEKKRRIQLHFGSRQIGWIPFWGISKLRRRGLVLTGEIPGEMREYDKWYKRMLSPDTFDQLAELGFNLAILPFSLGGCTEMEREEHEDFRCAAKLCAERGIVVLPYLQYQNMLPESSHEEYHSWAIHPDGTPVEYADYRPTLCQTSEEFQSYFKGLVKESQQLGANGIWVDNSYLYPCVCPECRRTFNQWLVENKKAMLDDLHLIPEKIRLTALAMTHCNNPVLLAFHQFNQERNVKSLRGLEQEMRKWNPDGLFGSNPGLYRGTNMSLKGVDFLTLLRFHDLVYLENTHCAGSYDGEIDGNYRGYVDCEALGVTAVNGAWKNGPALPGSGQTGLPEPEETAPILLEPLLFGGAAGAYWLIREMPDKHCRCGKDKEPGYFEYPPMNDALAETMKIVNGIPVGTTNQAPVGVWFSSDSWKFDYKVFEESRLAVTEALTAANIPWRAIFDDAPETARDLELLVVPNARIFSDEKVAELKKIADSGVKILVVGGDCALFDENLLRRNDSALAEFCGSSMYAQESYSVCGAWHLLRDDKVRGGRLLHIYDPAFLKPGYLTTGLLAEKVKALAPPPFEIEENKVVGTLRKTAEGKELFLLLDYATPCQTRSVKIRFAENRSGILRRPGKPDQAFEGKELVIPDFRLFAMIW